MRNSNEPDWRRLDRQRRSEDVAAVLDDLKALCVGMALGVVLLAVWLVRLAPLIVAVFAAIILARCAGVL